MAGLAMDAAPPDTNTGVAVDPAPGVAAPVVAVGPATDVDVGTADGVLPDVADFDPIPAGRDRDEVTAVAPDGADFDQTSLDSASARGRDATAAMPIDTGRVVDGVSDRGFGTGAFADEVLSADVVDFDPHSAWDDGDEVTAALPDGAHTVTTTVAATGAKRKRGHRKHVTRDARKLQRRRPLAMHGSAPGTDTGSGVRQSDNT